MTPAHDPRPASRYQAVTPSIFSLRLGATDRVASAEPAPTATRVLRRVPARLLRIVAKAG